MRCLCMLTSRCRALKLEQLPHRLKKILRERLEECGWRDEVKAHCRSAVCCFMLSAECDSTDMRRADVLKEQPELSSEELVVKVKPKGRAAVPDSVKADLLARLRTQITV